MAEAEIVKKITEFEDKSLLIVDDDNPFRERLARAMEKKGFSVSQAEGVKIGIESVKSKKPAFAVVDLRLNDGNGLEVVKEIQKNNSESRIVMLTGYGNIPTAVAAIKEGAIDYLAKPAAAPIAVIISVIFILYYNKIETFKKSKYLFLDLVVHPFAYILKPNYLPTTSNASE